MGSLKKFAIAVLVIGLSVSVSGCGFRPLYGERSVGASTVDAMALVQIGTVSGRYGQILRNYLLDRLNPRGRAAAPRYRLDMNIETQKEALAIEQDESVERFNFSLTAKYRLVDLNDAKTVFQARSQSIAAYNVVRSDYATLVAENDAASRVAREVTDDIKIQLAIFFDRVLSPERG
jgi:LPS-assembly lipoprotein